ncbi:MAG TPA: hypothetical protein VKN99_07915 [Polyangia bacterium]|nr:hypothetical protein [Polyangia bacterium]
MCVALALVGACGLFFTPASALAKKRIVILNFKGPQAKKAQAALTARARKKFAIIPEAAFQKTAKELHIARPTDDDVANVARKLRADAIVAGVVHRNGRKWELTVTVRDGASGRPDRASIPLKGPRVTTPVIAQMHAEVMPLLEHAEAGGALAGTAGGDSENPLAMSKTKKTGALEPAAQPVGAADPTAGAMGAQGDRDNPIEKKEPEAQAAQAAPAAERPPWRPLATAALGLSGTGRSLSPDGNGIQGYSGSLVAAFDLAAELNPLAGRSDSLRGLGLYFTLDKVISVSSTLKCDPQGMMTQSLDSSELMFTIGAQYGYRLREAADAVTVGARFGYGLTSFSVTVPPTPCLTVTVPDVSYKYLDLGPYLKVPLRADSSYPMEITARFSYLPVLDAGQIASGGRAGTIGKNGSASGLELALGWSLRFRPWLDFLAAFRLQRFGVSIDSGGAVNGFSDLYYTIGAGAGIVY